LAGRKLLQLYDACDAALIVRGFPFLEFDRTPLDRDTLRGFALGWNSELTLIQEMDDVHFRLNGYAIFRNSDVKRWRPVGADDLWARAVKLNKLRPAKPEGLRYSSWKEAVSSAGATFPLITIHRERLDRTVCYVGKVRRTSLRATTILPISPQAEWEPEECYQLKDITFLEFGGAYETLLARFANNID
jgi:hypothetical protein